MPRTISPGVLWRKLYPVRSWSEWKKLWYARGRTVTFEEQNSRAGILVQAFALESYEILRGIGITAEDGVTVLDLTDMDYYCRGVHHNFETRNMGKKTVAGEDKTIEFTMVPKEADEVSLSGAESVVTDNEPTTEVYLAELDLPLKDVPVVFTTTFLLADIDEVDAGDVSDFIGDGVTVLTDEEGKASIGITFSDDVDKTANIVATIADTELHVATGGDSDTLAVAVDTEFKVANAVTLAGEAEILSDDEPVQETYTATLDLEWADIPVTFTTGFGAADIESVAEGDVADFTGAGLEVLTGADGKASITVTFAAGRAGSENIVAGIDDGDERVATSDTGTVAVTLDTQADTTDGVSIAGAEEIRSDNERVTETYTATLDDIIENVPVTFTTDFLVGDIYAVDPGEVNDLVGDGITINTDEDGKASIDITFEADVEKIENVSAAISQAHIRVSADADDDVSVDVDTRLISAESVDSLTGEQSIVSDNAPVQEAYVAQLDLAMAGIPVKFTTTGIAGEWLAEDIDAIEEGEVAALLGDGLEIETDETGKATITITFAAGVDKTDTLKAEIEDAEERVRVSDDETLEVVVDTTLVTTDDVTLTGEETVQADNQRVTETYTADIGIERAGIPVTFVLDTYSAGQIYAVDPEEVNDLLFGGIVVPTGEDGTASIDITFESDVDTAGDLTASISDEHERVTENTDDTITITTDTRLVAAEGVTLTGEQSIRSDSDPVQEEYTAQIDIEMANVPVLFTSTFLEGDIDAVSAGTVEDLVGAGVEVLTDATGKAKLSITFSDDVDKQETLVAAIDDSAERVRSSDDDTLAITVDTEAKIANAVTLGGDTPVLSNNLPEDGEYTAALDIAWAGIPVLFTTAFTDDHIEAVSPGDLVDLLGGGLEVDSDENGEAKITITFKAGVDQAANLVAAIDDEHPNVGTDDDDTLLVTVDTTTD